MVGRSVKAQVGLAIAGMYLQGQPGNGALWYLQMEQLLVGYAMAVNCTDFPLLYPMVPEQLDLVNPIVYSTAYSMRYYYKFRSTWFLFW